MTRPTRARWIAVALVLACTPAAVLVACGLDLGGDFPGTDAASDVTTSDVVVTDTSPPMDVEDTGVACTVQPCAIRVAAGGAHTCAIFDTRDVRCWGSNAQGELGAGVVSPPGSASVVPAVSPSPLRAGQLASISAIFGGGRGVTGNTEGFSCAVDTASALKCWGDNRQGQLGRGMDPPDAGMDAGTDADADAAVVDAGPPPALVFADPAPGAVNVPPVLSVALGLQHACSLHAGGVVNCWGSAANGELGRDLGGATMTHFPGPPALPGGETVTHVSTGNAHTCVRYQSATVSCWGNNALGQLGNPDNSTTPPKVAGVANVASIHAGDFITCAVLNDGSATCWGTNGQGQLGRGTIGAADPAPGAVLLPPGRNVRKLVMGHGHSCALLDDGSVTCWGNNQFGQCGRDMADGGVSSNYPTPIIVAGVANVIDIAAGGAHTCAVIDTGRVLCWGKHTEGQLGPMAVDGGADATDMSQHPNPVAVPF